MPSVAEVAMEVFLGQCFLREIPPQSCRGCNKAERRGLKSVCVHVCVQGQGMVHAGEKVSNERKSGEAGGMQH